MIRVGEPPYLECSGEGFRPFSAFFAKIKARNSMSVEFLYQTAKVVNGILVKNIADGKGKHADNQEFCNGFYMELWYEYIRENSHYLDLLRHQRGLSDKFGQVGHVCQAKALWHIRCDQNLTS